MGTEGGWKGTKSMRGERGYKREKGEWEGIRGRNCNKFFPMKKPEK